MAKLDQALCIYYGIRPNTFEVESVSETVGGFLSGNSQRHIAPPDFLTERKINIGFGLTDVISIPANMLDKPEAQQMIADLEKKAQEMRQAAAQKH